MEVIMDGKNLIENGKAALEPAKTILKATPLVDIYENEHEILLHVEIPGVSKNDIKVHIDNGVLTLSGVRTVERKGVSEWEEIKDVEYHRSFSVPPTIDTAKVSADLVNGVLALSLPKSEAAKPRTIEIKAK